MGARLTVVSTVTVSGNVASGAESAAGAGLSKAAGGDPGLVVDGALSPQRPDLCLQLAGDSPALHVLLASTVAVNFLLIYTDASEGGKYNDKPARPFQVVLIDVCECQCVEAGIDRGREIMR